MKVNFDFLYRKKKYDDESIEQSQLNRVLTFIDLTALGVSCTLGSGIYVLAGTAIANFAGPSVIISFIIAGLSSFFAGLCYAELGARVPRCGSAYVYIYVTIGEFVAFIMGWDLILEYVIGTSSTASALSLYIDSLVGNKIQQAFLQAMPMNLTGLASYPDFLAFALCIFISSFLVIGVQESSFLNKIFTLLNILVILFIIIAGVTKADVQNWSLAVHPNLTWTNVEDEEVNCTTSKRCGEGGFAPFGFDGIIKGAAKCFYAYIGFDAIATTGEEVLNAKKTIPMSILLTLIVVSLSYCGVTAVLTFMIPYYILDPDVPLKQAFEYVNLSWASYVVTVGAIASLATCLYASMFPMPRVTYSIAYDGLIFKFLAWVPKKLKTPAGAAIATGLFAGILVLIFDLDQLIDMMSIGTLMAYSLVAACVLVLRYRPTESNETKKPKRKRKTTVYSFLFGHSDEPLMKRIFKPDGKCCTETSQLVNTLSVTSVLVVIFICIVLTATDNVARWYSIVPLAILVLILLGLMFAIWKQPQNPDIDTFKVPLVPAFPLVSIFVNVYLMLTLPIFTWLRWLVWFVVGIFVYFGYGIRNSKLNVKNDRQNRIFPCIERTDSTTKVDYFYNTDETPTEIENVTSF